MSDEPGIFEIVHSTRAMRRLRPDPVPDRLIEKILEAGASGPSGNRYGDSAGHACIAVAGPLERSARRLSRGK